MTTVSHNKLCELPPLSGMLVLEKLNGLLYNKRGKMHCSFFTDSWTVCDNPGLSSLPDLTPLTKLRILGVSETALPREIIDMTLQERLAYFRTTHS